MSENIDNNSALSFLKDFKQDIDRIPVNFTTFFSYGDKYSWSKGADWTYDSSSTFTTPTNSPAKRYSEVIKKEMSMDESFLGEEEEEEEILWRSSVTWTGAQVTETEKSKEPKKKPEVTEVITTPEKMTKVLAAADVVMDSPREGKLRIAPIKQLSSLELAAENQLKRLEGKKLLKNLPAPSDPFFSRPTNPIVNPKNQMFDSATRQVHSRLITTKERCNNRFGIVPISNSFTFNSAGTRTSSGHHSPSKNVPPSPALPTKEERNSKALVIFQVEFCNQRQGIFQGLDVLENGLLLEDVLNEYVLLTQDDGVEIAKVISFEYLAELVPKVPEVSFQRIIRLARSQEVVALSRKSREEAFFMPVVVTLIKKEGLAQVMECRSLEFQYDRNKLILYVDMKQWTHFNDFVKLVHAKVESIFGFQVRIFVQRRFI